MKKRGREMQAKRESGGAVRRTSGWWNTPVIRKNFAEMSVPELCAEYGISANYVFVLRKKIQETPLAPETSETPGSRLRAVRESQKMTQAEFGDAIGVHQRTIRRWEIGDGRIPKTACKLIYEKFGKKLENSLKII